MSQLTTAEKIILTSQTPALFVFLVDQSSSMKDTVIFQGRSIPKKNVVAAVVNKFIRDAYQTSLQKCKKVTNRCFISIIAYADNASYSLSDEQNKEYSYLGLTEFSDQKNKFAKGTESTRSGEKSVWLMPESRQQGTSMIKALNLASGVIRQFVQFARQGKYEPSCIYIFNLTDGDATDAGSLDPTEAAKEVRFAVAQLENHGAVVFTLHFASGASKNSIRFPSDENFLQSFSDDKINKTNNWSPRESAQLALAASSKIPPQLKVMLVEGHYAKNSDDIYAYMYNEDLEVIERFFSDLWSDGLAPKDTAMGAKPDFL